LVRTSVLAKGKLSVPELEQSQKSKKYQAHMAVAGFNELKTS
jgi:hypothetical protein